MNQMNGLLWAQQFQAPGFHPWGGTQGGNPLMPTVGGYGQTPNMPYMTAPKANIRPAGYGPMGLGTEGINLSFFLAKPVGGAGRNPYGDTGRQGRRNRVMRVGVQGFDATALRVK